MKIKCIIPTYKENAQTCLQLQYFSDQDRSPHCPLSQSAWPFPLNVHKAGPSPPQPHVPHFCPGRALCPAAVLLQPVPNEAFDATSGFAVFLVLPILPRHLLMSLSSLSISAAVSAKPQVLTP